jgi:hypothetical protein
MNGRQHGRNTDSDLLQLTEWKLVVAFNVIIELALFALPVWLVWGLQTSVRRKVTVVSVFGLRLPYVKRSLLSP